MPATNKIVLGTVQFGLEYGINNNSGKPNKETIKSILDFAFQNNIRLLDTAEEYGDSQEVIGSYHKISSNKFNIITKFSHRRDNLSKNLTTRIYQNLKTLNVDSFYSYMFHSFTDFKTYFYLYKNEIKQLKKEGVIGRFGVSVYTNQETERLLEYDMIDLIQLPFNLLDNNNQRSEIIKKAKDKGIEIHTRSTFLQGLFFKNEIPHKLLNLKPYLNRVNEISKEKNISLNNLALNYVCQQRNIDKILIGVDSVSQLEENVRSLRNQISLETVKKIDSINVLETSLLNPSNWSI